MIQMDLSNSVKVWGSPFVVVYESIAELAAEIGMSPDFVIYVCFRLSELLGAVKLSLIFLGYRLLRYFYRKRHPAAPGSGGAACGSGSD